MAGLYDLVAMTVSSAPGTGATISLGAAATINGVTYLSFASAGTAGNASVSYSILDTAGASEIGTATYLSSGPLLSGRTPTKSTNANAAINASAAAIVQCSARAEDIISTDLSNTFTATQQAQARTNVYAAPFDALAFSGMQINGACEISQERVANSFAMTSAVGVQVQDGWNAKFIGAATLAITAFPADTTTIPTGFQSCIRLNATTGLASLAAGDYGFFAQSIEGYRVSRLDFGKATAQSITIGFWVNCTIAGTMTVALQNSASNRTYPANVTINNAATWEYKTVTVAGDTSGTWLYTNGVGLAIFFCFGSGSTKQGTANQWNGDGKFATSSTTNFFATTGNSAAVTGLIVLPGTEVPLSARSQFIVRPSDTELLLCQRYYRKSFPQGTAVAQNAGVAGAVTVKNPVALGDPSVYVQFSPTMRTTPTITTYNPSVANANWRDITAGADATVSVDPGTTIGDAGVLIATSGTIATLGDVLAIHYSADARL